MEPTASQNCKPLAWSGRVTNSTPKIMGDVPIISPTIAGPKPKYRAETRTARNWSRYGYRVPNRGVNDQRVAAAAATQAMAATYRCKRGYSRSRRGNIRLSHHIQAGGGFARPR